jgi:Fe-S-cluster containining protein
MRWNRRCGAQAIGLIDRVVGPARDRTHHFACTRCGACCNRSPEVLLSEAAPLADQFVFRLMFRLYHAPRQFDGIGSSAAFYERRRLLGTFAAHQTSVRLGPKGQAADYSRYLLISALTFDITPGMCAARTGPDCGIYARRPVACHTVPLHYSRPAAEAAAALSEFTARDGYRCDTSPDADILLDGGVIVDEPTRTARARAVSIAAADQRWATAIVRAMKTAYPAQSQLPTIGQIVDSAHRGVMTTSMRVAWDIAMRAGLMSRPALEQALASQLGCIDRAIGQARATASDLDLLAQMRAEYATARQN